MGITEIGDDVLNLILCPITHQLDFDVWEGLVWKDRETVNCPDARRQHKLENIVDRVGAEGKGGHGFSQIFREGSGQRIGIAG